MILTIIAIVAIGYIGLIFLAIGFSFAMAILTGDWELFSKDFGWFLYMNGGLFFGFSVGMFIFGNIVNWFVEWGLQGYSNPNFVGMILLIVSIVLYTIGKIMMKEHKETEIKKDRYVTLKSGKRIKVN